MPSKDQPTHEGAANRPQEVEGVRASTATRFFAGQVVDGWSLVKFLGAGAFGETWRAVDPEGVPAALKLLEHAPGDEMRALSRIVHPAVVGVLDAGGGAQPYLAMEYAPGRTLEDLEGLALDDALAITAALLDALAAVHAVVVAHGDIKPENLIVSMGGPKGIAVKLIDFGLAGGSQGGTLAWAAPERLQGGASSPDADVYAAGLILWTLLHGSQPFAELGPGEALLRRRSTLPEATEGPAWVKELLRELLSLDPGRRPTAAAAADTLAAHGVPLPTIDAGLLRRRARSVRVPRPADEAVRTWMHDGGTLAVVGGPGSGRSHVLQRALVELSAEGHTFTRLQANGSAWGAVAAALSDPRLPGEPAELPDIPDVADRAYAAARLILRRAQGPLRVLVDDIEELDSGSRRLLELLATDPHCDVLVTAAEAPTFVDRVEELQSWDLDSVRSLITQLLGAEPADVVALVSHVVESSGGVPRLAVEAVVAAVDEVAVVHEARRWIEDSDRLRRLPPPAAHPAHDLTGLSREVLELGAMAACIDQPRRLSELADLVSQGPSVARQALEQLAVRGLARVEGDMVRVVSRVAAEALKTAHGDAASLHAKIVANWTDASPSSRLGWHLAGAGDANGVAEMGPFCLHDALRRDSAEAANLADALWALAQTPQLAAGRLDALVAGGRPDDAVAFGAELLEIPRLSTLNVLVALARAHQSREEFDAALDVVERAKELTEVPPLPLLEVEAQAQFRKGEPAFARDLAQSATGRGVPAGPEGLAIWLRLKGIEAQAQHALGDLEGAIKLLEDLPPGLGLGTSARGLLDAMQGRLLWHAGRFREAADVMAQVAKLSGGLGALDRARLANNAALANYQVGDLAAAVAQWERSRLLFERLGTTRSQVAVQLNLCVGYLELGRWERARKAGEWAMEHAGKLEDLHHEAMAAGNLGDVYRLLGRHSEAKGLYRTSVALAEEGDLTAEHAEGLRRLAQLAVELNEPDAAELCDKAERYGRDVGARSDAALAAALRGVVHARNEELPAANSALARSRSMLSDSGDARDLAEWRLCSALVNEALGRTERAVTELARVVLYADEVGSVQLRNRTDAVAQRIEGAKLRAGPDREEMILEMAVRVAREQDLDSLLQTIADGALALTEADRAFVLRRDPEEVAAKAIRPDGDQSPPSWSIAHRAMAEGRDVIVADLGDRPDLRASTSVMVLDLRSVMCVPLVRGGDVLGALYVDSREAGELELMEVGRYLRALAGYAAIAITNAERVAANDRRIEDAAGVAHDMRNLALVLIGLAEDVSEHEINPETIDAMHDVEQVGRQLVRMTDRFLHPDIKMSEAVDVVELTRQLASIVSHEAQRRKVTLGVDAVPDAVVIADPDSLRRALFNLVHNAFKYCGDGGRVDLKVVRTRDLVVFEVRDSGPGIPADVVPHVFDFRRQGRQARKGYGIGLSVAARAVLDAGGTIRAANHHDGGALITIELPRVDSGIGD